MQRAEHQMAGLGGGLYAHYTRFVSPEVFLFSYTVTMVIMAAEVMMMKVEMIEVKKTVMVMRNRMPLKSLFWHPRLMIPAERQSIPSWSGMRLNRQRLIGFR
jgi:hypothetical protein